MNATNVEAHTPRCIYHRAQWTKDRPDLEASENIPEDNSWAQLFWCIGDHVSRKSAGTDFSEWLGLGTQSPENPEPRFSSDQDLWEPE